MVQGQAAPQRNKTGLGDDTTHRIMLGRCSRYSDSRSGGSKLQTVAYREKMPLQGADRISQNLDAEHGGRQIYPDAVYARGSKSI